MLSDISLKDIPKDRPESQSLDCLSRTSGAYGAGKGRWIVGLAASCLIAYLARRQRALTSDGAIAAIGTGTLTTALGGYGRALLMVAFFAASTGFSRLGHRRKREITVLTAKGSTRDARQVLANGGLSTAIAAISSETRGTNAYVGTLAAVTGDTWATEIGGLSASVPRHILTWKPVPTGSSGGVTALGTLASVAGGAFIGALAACSGLFDRSFRRRQSQLVITGVLAGSLGSLVDSVLGATLQERRWCPTCHAHTERRVHVCGTSTQRIGGVRGIDNDVVNLLCSFTGAAIGFAVDRLAHRDNAPRW